MIIAIDGTTASGKGTLARRLAALYRLPYLDTGLLYRGVAALCLRHGVDLADAEACADQARRLDPAGFGETSLRGSAIGAAASVAAAHGPVRAALFDLQTRFAARSEGAVLDGRDIATVIAPSADVKFWVDADIEERARRRWRELVALGEAVGLDAVTAQLRERDARDAGRASAPMRISPDAVRIDTTTLGPDAVFERARATLADRGFVPPSAP